MKSKDLFSIKLLVHVIWILPLVFTISCKEKKDPEPKNRPPGAFSASIISSDTSAVISWTEAADPDGDAVKYAIIFDNITEAELLQVTNYTINSLEAGTNHLGKIVAADGKGGFAEAEFDFDTNENPNSIPGSFTVSTTINADEATISWTAATDPDGDLVTYDLEFGGAIIQTDLTILNHKVTALTYNTTYSGKVIAKDGKGGIREQPYSFMTGSELNNAPGNFTVSASATGNGAAITWTASTDPDGDAIKYDVVLEGSIVQSNLTSLSHTLSNLEYSKTYSGKIIAKDGKGGSTEKSYAFTTGAQPNTPPGNFAVSTSVSGNGVTITWTAAVDPDGDAVQYDVVFDGSTVQSNLTGLSHTLSNLEYSKIYSGKIIAKDGKGGINEQSYTFTTGVQPNSPPGNFTAQVDNINGNTANFSWSAAVDPDGDAVTYSISLNGGVQQSGITATSVSLNNLLYSTTYNVIVSASDGNGGTSSDSFSFTMPSAPPQFPVTAFSIASNLVVTHFPFENTSYEYGLEFEPTTDGTITALGAKLCFGTYTIRIWNAATMTEISSAVVSINNPDQSCNVLHMTDITPVVVQKGIKYMVTVNANNWYNYVSTTLNANIMPVTKGNIKFTRYGYVAGQTAYPTTFSLTRFAGVAEFKFVPDH